MSFEKQLNEIQDLFKEGNRQMAEAMYTLKQVKDKMQLLKQSDELKYLPQEFLNSILGGNEHETRN